MLNPKTLLIIGGAIALQNLNGGFSGLSEMKTQGDQNRQTRSRQTQEQARLTLAQDAAKQRDQIAHKRYESGCLMVVSSKDTKNLTALSEGQPVIDSARQVPLSVGNIVCDSNGLTGEIIPNPDNPAIPVVGNTAFTSDRTIVASAMKRYTGTRYTMPKQ
jgi:hypothetical protein